MVVKHESGKLVEKKKNPETNQIQMKLFPHCGVSRVDTRFSINLLIKVFSTKRASVVNFFRKRFFSVCVCV